MQAKTPALLMTLALASLGPGCVKVNSSAPTVSADRAQATQDGEAAAEPPAASQEESISGESMAAPLPEEGTKPSPGDGANLPRVEDIRPPLCQKDGTRSEGWYRDGKLLIHASCQGVTPECKMSGTRSEGWYAGDELIEYDQCDGKLPE